MTLAFNDDGQPVAHREHAQFDPLVLVQLLVEGIQSLRGEVTGSRIHHFSAPQHLHIRTHTHTLELVSFCSQAAHLSASQHDECTYIVNRNDPPCSYELQGLLVVSVVVDFISIDEHKVVCSIFPGCHQLT